MVKYGNYMKAVETLLEPKWKLCSSSNDETETESERV